ncbi:methionine-rich copper-binding protein CopC [Planomicrobium stackebrandtii]|uniref:Methionine-rich copper-binding protein CopC n=1 Tax=Planomicrobium stackebrandtii TaxID=253160 RepID=A0ABU0GVY3_9BACL|nr:copper resistance protein CopC [Planomicrobium stackebrandtii]MDQ0429478.1 methionine-rich copper-binding protein CopC [Planomicrobium stackebrandtii]
MKKIITLLVLAIFSLPLIGQAHTTLSSSSPAEGEVMVEPLEEVVLTFGTVIEQGSSMTLESEGTTYEFDEITLSDSVMTGSLSEELPNAAYTIRWEIIGADGHPIEGEVPFELNVEAVAEEPAAEEAETEEEPTTEEAVVETETPAEEENAVQPAEDEGNSIITVFLVAALLAVVFIAYRLLKKK